MSRYTIEPYWSVPSLVVDDFPVDPRSAEYEILMHGAAHALNHLEPLRDLLAKVGEHLVRSNYAGGLLSEIDKALLDSKV